MKDQQNQQDGVQVRTILSDQGVASVAMVITTSSSPPVNIAMLPDAAAEIGLNLLAASYAARSEAAAYTYSKRHSLNTEELLKILRNGQ